MGGRTKRLLTHHYKKDRGGKIMKELLKDNDIVKALENQANGYGAGIVGDLSALTLDLVHRQKAEIERLISVQVELQDLYTKYYNDAKDLRREKTELQKQVEAWKAKARELEQSWEISSSNEVVLQKQVYELKNDLRKSVELIKEGGELAKMNNEIIAQVYEQAVKDTAKEILQELLKWLNQSISFSNGKSLNGSVQYGAMNKAYHEVKRRVKKIAESKGVEVE